MCVCGGGEREENVCVSLYVCIFITVLTTCTCTISCTMHMYTVHVGMSEKALE